MMDYCRGVIVTKGKVSKEAGDILREDVETLQAIFPQAFSESKVDFEKLKIALGVSYKVVTSPSELP